MKYLLYCYCCFLCYECLIAQTAFTKVDTLLTSESSSCRIMFYNVENLFDTVDDSLKRDEDFTPTGMKGWSKRKYETKLKNIYQTIAGVGDWNMPAIIGLCEIENRFVLEELVNKTPLQRFDYQIVHEESPDKRGIDVGLLYHPEKFTYLSHETLPIQFPFDTASRTRDVLLVTGKVFDQDTIHVFVNHWPSRFGGHIETDPKRAVVAQTVRDKVLAIYQKNPTANIIIMGDLNDHPYDDSVAKVLKAKRDTTNLTFNDLYNLTAENEARGEGTHKHKDHWGILDHLIVSPSLLQGKKGLGISSNRAVIFKAPWLIEKEEKGLGERPFRTYIGARFHDGYSDHLPIFLDLVEVD